ncbi:hypothetical protein PSHT_09137 [Puccinia striiformis]|uniref:THIF-type NAD/FAD binding fold domain-containing protein n=2 Tax=Puccinia striiformis TaxID=27350 RepID=A0A2S4VIJ2_9BASI|nr:hypothetical protein KEM48_012533 [Puccinia striiformis f. sp. tritici PST-130]POW09371.1 hypothetical protein PSHT_09137 [Puccinia striiformis]POW17052.1 hypothetical protein PSTT_00866 [Puccinia striiformis]
MAQLGTTFLSTSHRSSLAITQAIVVGVVSGALAALAMYSFQGSANSTPADDPKARKKPCTENPVHDESLIAEQLARNLAFLGPPGNQNVRNAFVIIIGLGGVGSSAATSLVRSGVGRIRLIDFDQVTLSSLNRHATATREDVGISKVISCKNFYQKIAPWLKIEALVEQFTIADAPRLLDGNPDWVLDCIDNITTKVDLLTYCKKNDLKVFSALGAASKADPSRIQIADISMTFEDPLARSVRRRLRQNGIIHGVPVVYSTEKPNENVRLLPLPEEEFQKGNVGELSALADFRVRILPVLGPLPSMFGQAMAAHTITQLANFPTQPLPIKNRTKVYHRIFNDLLAREFRLNGATTIPFSDEDIGYIFEDLYRGRSVVHPAFKVSSHPCMIRWSMDEELHWTNCVVMDRSEADIHQQKVLVDRQDPRLVWGSETVELVKARFSEELQMSVSPPTRSCNINIFPVLFFI